MFEEEGKIYNLLITRGEKDKNNEYAQFTEKLYSRPDFLWKETAIGANNYLTAPESFFDDIDAIIILSGLYNDNKEQMNHLVKIAEKKDITLVLVRPFGMEEVPLELEKYSDGIVGWNAACIIDMIKSTNEL